MGGAPITVVSRRGLAALKRPRNEAYLVRDLVTIAPVTTRVRRIPTEAPLGPDEGLPKRCVANLDAITTIPKRALTARVVALSLEKVAAIDRAPRFALALPE